MGTEPRAVLTTTASPVAMPRWSAPPVFISITGDADQRGIATGDAVVVRTARGSVPMRASVTDAIMAGFAYAAVGGVGPLGTEEWRRANVNCLTDFEQFDAISGFPVYKTLLCQISKKKRQRRGMAVQDPSLGCVG